MSKVSITNPELREFLNQSVLVRLNKGRKVTGILRGFDPFMNVVLQWTARGPDDVSPLDEEGNISHQRVFVIRGSSISYMVLEKLMVDEPFADEPKPGPSGLQKS